MRCKHCNVDLPENYKLCPLCGNAASYEETKIKGLSSVSYPKNEATAVQEPKQKKSKFSFEKIKAYFNI